MAEVETELLQHEVRIEARPEVVFAYFTDPARLVKWKGRSATLDPRPGGTYRVEINDLATARGEYVEVDPPRRVVFTWGWEGENPVRPGSTTVEVDLVPDGEATIVRLTHRGLPAAEADPHRKGWVHYLGRLSAAAAGRDPGPDPHERMESI